METPSTPSNRTLSFLLVAPSYACKPVTGSGQRTLLIYKALSRLGRVDVLLLGGQDAEVFRPYFPEVNVLHIVKPDDSTPTFWQFMRPISAKLADRLATAFRNKRYLYQPDSNVAAFFNQLQNAHSYDFVVGRYLRPTARAGAIASKKAPLILDIDDRDDVVYKSRLNLPGLNPIERLFLRAYSQQTESVTAELLPQCDHVWLTSESDAQAIAHPSKSILPNIPYTLRNHQPEALEENRGSKTVLFVGSYAHRVNVEGVERFILNCWPKINSAVKGANLRVVGSGNWKAEKPKFSHILNVEIVGFADDLAEEYQKAAFTVAPLFEGGGTKIKVLETLLYQRTAVITNHAQYGYDTIRHRESLWVGATEAELVEGCIELLNNPALRAKMALKGHETVVKEYSFDRFASLVQTSVERLAGQV